MAQYQIPQPKPPIAGVTIVAPQSDPPALAQPDPRYYALLQRVRHRAPGSLVVADGPSVTIPQSYLFTVGQPISARAYLIPGVAALIDVLSGVVVVPPVRGAMTGPAFGHPMNASFADVDLV
jgi:hypothetical protein